MTTPIKIWTFTSLLLQTVVLALTSQQYPTVKTNLGDVRGIAVNRGSTHITKFLGIPFAKAPVGHLRFMKPETPDPWNGVLNTTKYMPACYEVYMSPSSTIKYSEDCLYLNVFVPGDVELNLNKPKAVMLWIYGGAWMYGNANSYPADKLTMHGDVIVVTFNYRLGLLGFTASADNVFPPNVALFDQHAVLLWVNENIEAFGGDSDRITIFGESVGADSVLYHYISPLSSSLFNRAIIQSVNTVETLQTKSEKYDIIKSLASPICGVNQSSRQILQCLQNMTVERMLKFGSSALLRGYKPVTVDGELLVDTPYKLLKEGKFNRSKELIVGYMADDGDSGIKGYTNWTEFIKFGITMNKAMRLVPLCLATHFKGFPQFAGSDLPNTAIMESLLYQNYLSCHGNPFDIARGVIDMFTDGLFSSKTFVIANSISKYGGVVFLYEFDHMLGYLKDKSKATMEISSGHTQDIGYVFGAVLGLGKLTSPEEKLLSLNIMKAFAEFARDGRPRYLTYSNKTFDWQPYTALSRYYLHFNTSMTGGSNQPVPESLLKRVSLWNTVINEIHAINTCDTYFEQSWPPFPSQGTEPKYLSLLPMIALLTTVM